MSDSQTSEGEPAVHDHFFRGLGESTRHNSLAYGYSLALTGAFGILTIVAGSPSVADIFLFGIGGALTFTIAVATATRGFSVRVRREPPLVQAIGSSLGFISVSGAFGAAALVGWAARGWTAWLVGPFCASATYLGLSALELVFARAVKAIFGLERLEEQR